MKTKRTYRRIKAGNIFDVANHIFLILVAFVFLYPIYYIFLYSISDATAAAKGSVVFWPIQTSFATYVSLLTKSDIRQAAFISAARTVVGTIITVMCSSYLAYVLSRDDLPHKKIIYRYVIITMYISAGLIPWYITMKGLGLKNNFLLYVLPSAISAFYIILVKTYIEQLPKSLEESAKLDGAGVFTLFFKIIMPLSLPIIATVAIFSAVNQWNSWQDNLYLVNVNKLQTLQYLLFNYMNSQMAVGDVSRMGSMSLVTSARKVSSLTMKMTMTMITILPILIVYPSMQKYFIKGIMIGAIKG
jgi:ABC-type glycerol-3-phosphate transport system permease component